MTECGTSPPLDTAFAARTFRRSRAPGRCSRTRGGTLAAAQVLDRIRTYMAEYQVQPGAAYPASARAAEMIAESHRAMAAMINAQPEEVVIGPSTTMNVFLLAQALRPGFREGDEIVVTNLDHEANVGAWRKLSGEGATVREWRFDEGSMALEPEGLAILLNERTRLVCFGHCSNIAGGFTDVPALVRMIHGRGRARLRGRRRLRAAPRHRREGVGCRFLPLLHLQALRAAPRSALRQERTSGTCGAAQPLLPRR